MCFVPWDSISWNFLILVDPGCCSCASWFGMFTLTYVCAERATKWSLALESSKSRRFGLFLHFQSECASKMCWVNHMLINAGSDLVLPSCSAFHCSLGCKGLKSPHLVVVKGLNTCQIRVLALLKPISVTAVSSGNRAILHVFLISNSNYWREHLSRVRSDQSVPFVPINFNPSPLIWYSRAFQQYEDLFRLKMEISSALVRFIYFKLILSISKVH